MSGHLQLTRDVPPEAYFVTSAIFHYLGPALAILLFAQVAPMGVAWLRIVSAAAVFTLWRPWRLLRELDPKARNTVFALGVVLAAMNSTFYLALEQLPLATVGAIEFVGPIALAAFGLRGRRNLLALALAAAGACLLVRIGGGGSALGYLFALANCALFVLYIVLGHRIAAAGGARGIRCLGLSMIVAALAAFPFGIAAATPAFVNPVLLAAAIAIGLCSSVVPYVLDQLAMARLSRGSFALLLTLLPATAVVVGMLVLEQFPTARDYAGIALVVAGVALHRRAS